MWVRCYDRVAAEVVRMYLALYLCVGLLVVRGDPVSNVADELEAEDVVANDTTPLPKPQKLVYSNVTSKQMMVSWTMDTPRYIDGYRVFYIKNKYTDVKTMEGYRTVYTLTGLDPYTTYDVWVKAYSEASGEGEESLRISVTTDTDVPSAPKISNISCFQTVQRPQQIYIEWKRPHVFYITVDYYYIYYKARGDAVYEFHQVQANTDDDHKFFLEKENSKLKEHSWYEVKICAGTKSILKTTQVFKGKFSNEETIYLPAVGRGCSQDDGEPPVPAELETFILSPVTGLARSLDRPTHLVVYVIVMILFQC